MRLAWIIAFSLLGSVGALSGAGVLFAFPKLQERLKSLLLAYAIGALLGAVFLGLLPEAIKEGQTQQVFLVTLGAIVVFFVLEKVLRLPHVHGHLGEHQNHEQSCNHHAQNPAGTLILIGDAFHNFVDGAVIALAFSISIHLGILTALAVVAHEIPQELGDFVILLQSGWGRWRAYWMNFLSALATLPGALLTFAAGDLIEPYLPYFLAVAAASFLYIAMTDLAPILHHDSGFKRSFQQLAGLAAGILTIALLRRFHE
jgi:zinc and cadmium transporter